MHDPYTAVIETRDPLTPMVRDDIVAALRKVRGIGPIEFERTEPVATVEFDATETGIAAIVRVVEDLGHCVVSVAQRATERLPRIEVVPRRVESSN